MSSILARRDSNLSSVSTAYQKHPKRDQDRFFSCPYRTKSPPASPQALISALNDSVAAQLDRNITAGGTEIVRCLDGFQSPLPLDTRCKPSIQRFSNARPSQKKPINGSFYVYWFQSLLTSSALTTVYVQRRFVYGVVSRVTRR